MCGIFCSVSRKGHIQPSDTLVRLLKARGPDAARSISTGGTADVHTDAGPFITFYSTVLSLRGGVTVPQPFRDPSTHSTLCWNGEAWSINGSRPEGNDTAQVSKLLQFTNASQQSSAVAHLELVQAAQNVASTLASLAGPYAFVFHDAAHDRIFFGRDFLGRRSLLWRVTSEGDLMISSVTDGNTLDSWSEVEADGIYCVDVSVRTCKDPQRQDCSDHRYGSFDVAKVPYVCGNGRNDGVESVIPLLSLNRDLSSGISALSTSSTSVLQLIQLLETSLYRRISNIPDPPLQEHSPRSSKPARLAILFSGGVDCTVLARMAHDILPLSEPIDLLNVAFENPRVHKNRGAASYELCPDRITGRRSCAELRRVGVGREWRFIAIDIPYLESMERRQEVVKLMYPHNTEMDLSIAHALYFAARGHGILSTSNDDIHSPYKTTARVLLSGLGADELFAGYTRHATAFRRNGFRGLLDELELDISRLGRRNLGRDDRVISNWSREVRFPFLDEELVTWALKAPVSEKCGFIAAETAESPDFIPSSDGIEPGKQVLRCVAEKLGMTETAREKKRAIQFGARTAKMEDGKTKGTTPIA